MKAKVKFRDTEFGLFEPSFMVPALGSAERFRGIYLDFEVDGVQRSQLVLDKAMPSDSILADTWDENPVFASTNDRVYWIIERALDCECDWGEEIEIEYEGEDEMEEKTITVPADADNEPLRMVAAVTLRTILPQVRCDVELVIRDDFTLPEAICRDFDSYVVRSSHGEGMMHKLKRSRVVEGEQILDLCPEIRICGDEGERLIQFIVEPPAPDEEG